MRFIPTRIHGALDYLWGLLLIAAPFAIGFASEGRAPWIAVIFGAGAIGYSLLTRYELGILKLIPMPVHLAFDAVAGLALALMPLVLGVSSAAGRTFVAFGLFSLLASLLTRRHAGPST